MRALRRAALLLAVTATLGAAAVARADEECGTRLTPETAAAMLAQERLGAYRLEGPRAQRYGVQSPQYQLKIPVTVHVVRKSDGSGGLADTEVDSSLVVANAYFAPIGFQFFKQDSTQHINSDFLYDSVNTLARINMLRQTGPVAGTINLYFTNRLADSLGTLCGYSSFTADAVQGIAFDNDCTPPKGNPSTVPHELGHYFDLLHTHETQSGGAECPDGSNCTTAGDHICDTPADPGLSRVGWVTDSCTYVGDTTACGGQVFSPDAHNLMSYSLKECRDRVTVQQMDRILATLVNLRPELIQAPGLAVTWVDYNYTGATTNGAYATPFKTLGSAIFSAPVGGTIVFKSSTGFETPTILKAVTLDSFRGPTTISP